MTDRTSESAPQQGPLGVLIAIGLVIALAATVWYILDGIRTDESRASLAQHQPDHAATATRHITRR